MRTMNVGRFRGVSAWSVVMVAALGAATAGAQTPEVKEEATCK
jgi:hypothetical protein